MTQKLLDFEKYQNKFSKFHAKLADRGGYVVFSNSGKGGAKKHFTLSLDSFLQCLVDINNNLTKFKNHENYVEKEWRDLGSKYYTDPSANAQSTVQTKPMFATLSKIIMWANKETLDSYNPESTIKLDALSVKTATNQLETLAKMYTPSEGLASVTHDIILSESTIRDFAFKVFAHFYTDRWEDILNHAEIKESKLNDFAFNSIDFGPFNRLIAQFPTEKQKEDLTSSNTLRYFEHPITSDDKGVCYFTTQWTGVGNNSLSFFRLKEYFESTFEGYALLKTGKGYILINEVAESKEAFTLSTFLADCESSSLVNNADLAKRFTASLLAKRFVILTGLSGSGKTKLAQAFVRWICLSDYQYAIVPVAADWTNREPLFGYPNALDKENYVMPESGVLDLILQAKDDSSNPYFLILDEMNLSHVERYFADFLSGLESDEDIPLHKSDAIEYVPQKVRLPKNLFVIGTVNIDETTYMFSPKVLDRANVIEFRVSEDEIEGFLKNPVKPDLETLDRKGAKMGASFVEIATREELVYKQSTELNAVLIDFFKQLKLSGAEFGYRTAHEMHRLAGALQELWPEYEAWEVIDICIMQKLLPKVHGSRRKMEPILKDMVKLCVDVKEVDVEDLLSKVYTQPADEAVYYPLSLEKLHRMYRGAIENGFTSYAEA